MNHQNVILPNTSLFLVDRSWKGLQGKSKTASFKDATKDNTFNQKEYLLEGSAVKAINQPWVPHVPQNDNTQEKEHNMRHCSNSKSTKSFKFVNATQPGSTQGPEVRTLIRSHVKTGVRRGSNARKSIRPSPIKLPEDLLPKGEKQSPNIEDRIPFRLNLTVPGTSSPLYGKSSFSLPMDTRSDYLLKYYLYVAAPSWYPLETHLTYNPVRKSWFSLAVENEFLFQSLLFASASHLAAEASCQNQVEPTTLLMPIFRYLNKTLQDKSAPSESTIAIVTCLAMVEISLGNYNKWKLHMTAIKEMTRLRGGLSCIEPSLQGKISRADIEGSVDTLTIPNLPALPFLTIPISSNQPDSYFNQRQAAGIFGILNSGCIIHQLQSIILDLSRITHDLCHATPQNLIDPRSLDEKTILICHNLLELSNPDPTTPYSTETSSATPNAIDLNEATTIATLLYTKSLTRSFGSIPSHSRPIIQRLGSSLSQLYDNWTSQKHEISIPSKSSALSRTPFTPSLPLLIWIHFMGGISTRGTEADFFAESLSLFLTADLGERDGDFHNYIQDKTWEDIKEILGQILWLPIVHDEHGRCFWEMVMNHAMVDKAP